jgi:cytochrome c oxidase subunit 1
MPTIRCSSPTSTIDAFVFSLAQAYFLFFIVLPAMAKRGDPAPAAPWEGAEGLEWEVPSPAPFHTFATLPMLNRTATRIVG